jgi:hypothetical protein
MANTTFSGPIRAGTMSNTTGTTVGDIRCKRWSSCNVSINYD